MSGDDATTGLAEELGISSPEELLAHALMIEVEAEERYDLLATQMEVHNNPELAAIFRKLAVIEGKHAEEIRQRTVGMDIPKLSPWQYQWPDMESPEAADLSQAHYRMTPWHALQLALKAEQRAHQFFAALARDTADAEVRKLAEEFAEEEAEHVRLVEQLLAKHREPDPHWAEDPDPAIHQE